MTNPPISPLAPVINTFFRDILSSQLSETPNHIADLVVFPFAWKPLLYRLAAAEMIFRPAAPKVNSAPALTFPGWTKRLLPQFHPAGVLQPIPSTRQVCEGWQAIGFSNR